MDAGKSVGIPPFDFAKLDALMQQAGIECILATSKHNTRYLLGGHYSHLFNTSPTMGLGSYMPVVGCVRGRVDASFFISNVTEAAQLVEGTLWVSEIVTDSWSSSDSATTAGRLVRQSGLGNGNIGLELSYIAADAVTALTKALPHANIVDASALLEELRAIKTPTELAAMRKVNELTVASVFGSLAGARPGIGKPELLKRLVVEDAKRDLTFHHCLTAAAPSLVRTPNADRWLAGGALSIDHGAEMDGYMGDVAGMAVFGQPSAELLERLAEIVSVQCAALAVMKPGTLGVAIFESAAAEQARCPHGPEMFFTAHGIGLNPHEAPRLTGFGFDAGPGNYEHRALVPGMVISVETQMKAPLTGFLKIEESVAITQSGFEPFATVGRDWNVVEI